METIKDQEKIIEEMKINFENQQKEKEKLEENIKDLNGNIY